MSRSTERPIPVTDAPAHAPGAVAPGTATDAPAAWDLTARILTSMGFAAAVIFTVNALKRAGVVPAIPPVQLLAPLGQLFAIALVIGLALLARPAHRRFTLVATVLLVCSLAGMTGIEFVLNFVLPYLDPPAIGALLGGPLGLAFPLASFFFLAAAIVAAIAWWRGGRVPRGAAVLFALSAAPIALRFALPDWAVPVGVAGIAVFALWAAIWAARAKA